MIERGIVANYTAARGLVMLREGAVTVTALREALRTCEIGFVFSSAIILASQVLALQLSNREIAIVAVVAAVVMWATAARKPGRRCKRCQELNRDHAVYCAQCGEKLSKNKSR